jgi:hypothetical protein
MVVHTRDIGPATLGKERAVPSPHARPGSSPDHPSIISQPVNITSIATRTWATIGQ